MTTEETNGDSHTDLSVRRSSFFAWAADLIRVFGTEVAGDFYQQLFTRHPAMAEYFPGMDSELQARQFAAILQLLAAYNENPLEASAEGIRVGMVHCNRGIGPDQFPIFADTLADVLSQYEEAGDRNAARAFWSAELSAAADLILAVMGETSSQESAGPRIA